MKTTIDILHATDAHIRETSAEDVKRRVDALTRYFLEHEIFPDLVVFSGDLTHSGTEDEFSLFEKIVINPIKRRLRLPDSRFLFTCGNHDVWREKITLKDHPELQKLQDGRQAEQWLRKIGGNWPRLEPYLKFQKRQYRSLSQDYSFTEWHNGMFVTRKLTIKGVIVGLACLNSAWLCADNFDKGKLFLTEYQINQVSRSLAGSDLQIAICHHPDDWLHPAEQDLAVTDMRRFFQLILTGHLHRPISTSSITPSAHSLTMTARALFEGKTSAKVEDGFHFYRLDISNRQLEAHFRKYVRIRDAFDKDTDHAQDGIFTFALPIPLNLQQSSVLVAQKLSVDNNVLATEVRKALSVLQGTDTPVFVTPKIRSFDFPGGYRRTLNSRLAVRELLGKRVVLCGSQDSGRTILLKSIAAGEVETPTLSQRKMANLFLSTKGYRRSDQHRASNKNYRKEVGRQALRLGQPRIDIDY